MLFNTHFKKLLSLNDYFKIECKVFWRDVTSSYLVVTVRLSRDTLFTYLIDSIDGHCSHSIFSHIQRKVTTIFNYNILNWCILINIHMSSDIYYILTDDYRSRATVIPIIIGTRRCSDYLNCNWNMIDVDQHQFL